MGKLGKKARKFAKKNLQSVHKRQRKMKSMFKRKAPRRREGAVKDSDAEGIPEQKQRVNAERARVEDTVSNDFLEDILDKDNSSDLGDISDSDSFLCEDSECPYILEEENEDGDRDNHVVLLGGDEKLRTEISMQKTKLDNLLEKDPKFAKFLESRRVHVQSSRKEEMFSDEEDDRDDNLMGDKLNEHQHDVKILTNCTIDVWCWLVKEQPDGPVFSNLLNGFRTACQYGIDSDECPYRIPDKEVFSKILTFVLYEADGIFRRRLGVSDSCTHERILKLKDAASWGTVGPLLKSYLRSCLFLLDQVAESQILNFVLSRLKVSTVFFAAFPSLLGRLIQVSTHLWVSGEESLSLSSFLLVRDIASSLGSDCLDKCLSRTYKTFIGHFKFVQPTSRKHMEFLANSLVELYSLDIQTSYQKVLVSLQQLSRLLRQALKTKKKEELKKTCNWQYMNCINLWVKFIACNIKDHDLRPLSTTLIEVIGGMACLFRGPRYLPLRLRCVHLLNKLSSATGVFIPVASLVFDCFEYRESSNADTKNSKTFDISTVLKAPKQLLKSRVFHEECIHFSVELLLAHFAQWSYHISFPEVATIPLILLRRFHEKTKLEGLRRLVKRLIDQVEQNIQFIQRKRDEVGYSPKDEASVESFLQMEKRSSNASFTQYYANALQKARFNHM